MLRYFILWSIISLIL